MASCRLVLSAGTTVSSRLAGWRFSQPYEVHKLVLDKDFIAIELFPSNNVIKIPRLELYSIVTCRRSLITTFRLNNGSWANIEGTCYLDPRFTVDSDEHFDFTVSNQSNHMFVKTEQTYGRNIIIHHSEEVSTKLMQHFPLEDQGMLLIYGPLPAEATSYPVDDIFAMEDVDAPEISETTGVGLVFKIDKTHVLVQYGNGVHTLERDLISTAYQAFSTGLPIPSQVPDEGEFKEIV